MIIPYGDDIQKRHPPFATIFIMAINVLVYQYEFRLFLEEPATGSYYWAFIGRWGLVPDDLLHGKVVGLISGMFLHGDFMHLAGNLFTMWLFAWTIELALGWYPFLIMYIFWGMVAGLNHVILDWRSSVPFIGASGAIFGIIGAYFVTFGICAQVRCLFNGAFVTGWRWVKFEIPAGAYVFFWLLVPQFTGVLGLDFSGEGPSPIAWDAHAGGFGAGAACMLLFGNDAMQRLRLNREGEWEIEQPVAVSHEYRLVPLGPVDGQLVPLPDDCQCRYCHAELDGSHRLDATLYRCPNPECRRLTYLNAS
jgi:membrane associated rhomboid family serine protease